MQRRTVALILLYFHVACTAVAYAQRSLTSFGLLTDLDLGYRPLGIAVNNSPAPVTIAVSSADRPELHFYALQNNGALVQTDTYRPLRNAGLIQSKGLKNGRAPAYVILAGDGESVTVLKRIRGDFTEESVSLPTPAERFILADINNDKREDILLFGKNCTGITTLLGKPDGSFAFGPLLFPELSVSDVQTMDLNRDGITDVVLLNWLSNELALYYGIGRMVFSEQVTLALTSEPVDLALSEVTKERTVSLAVTLPEEQLIALCTANALGEIQLTSTLECGGRPTGLVYANINSDGFPDLVTCTEQGIVVALGKGQMTFHAPALFSAGSAITTWTVADADGDKKNDCVLVDSKTNRLVVLANAQMTAASDWPSHYCVGNSPQGLATGDFNGDGFNDIAVANAGSSTISILLNKGNGRFAGQQTIQVPGRPLFVRAVDSPGRSEKTLVTAHHEINRLTVIRLGADLAESSTFSMPTGPDPYVLWAREPLTHERLEILLRSSGEKEGSTALSFFEQLSGSRFLERKVKSNFPYAMSCLTMDDVNQDSTMRLMFAWSDRRSGRTTVSVALAGEGTEFAGPRSLFSYPDSTFSTGAIIAGFVNGDQYKDIIVSLDPPRNTLGISYGRGNGAYRDTLLWIPGVHLLQEDALILTDADGDGAPDITYIDAAKHSVVTLYGQPNGKFETRKTICPAGGVSAIRVASLRRPHEQDLILSETGKGVVSIIFDPFKK